MPDTPGAASTLQQRTTGIILLELPRACLLYLREPSARQKIGRAMRVWQAPALGLRVVG
jgi:hypothetical protein